MLYTCHQNLRGLIKNERRKETEKGTLAPIVSMRNQTIRIPQTFGPGGFLGMGTTYMNRVTG